MSISRVKRDPSMGLGTATDYLPLVHRIARRVLRRLPSHVRLDDLISAGTVGLLEALERYRPGAEGSFESYAAFRIKGSILDELRRRDLMARDARIEAKRLERAMRDLEQDLGRPASDSEVATFLGIDLPTLHERLEKLAPVQVFDVDEMFREGVPESGESPFELVAKAQTLELLAQSIGELSEKQQQVLQLYYYENLTLKEIGEVLDVTESRVCQILSETTLRLRAKMTPSAKVLVLPTDRKDEVVHV